MKKYKSKKICAGEYLYRNHRVVCHGYYEPDHKVVWEGIDNNTGEAVAHGYTKKEVINRIDMDLDKVGL